MANLVIKTQKYTVNKLGIQVYFIGKIF